MSNAVIMIVQVYGALGGLVALAFLFWGVDRVAPDARGAYVFRPLLVPGVVLLWPLVLWRWQVLEREREAAQRRHRPPRRSQDVFAALLALAIPIILVVALLIRQQGPFEWPAQQIEQASTGEAGQ